MTRYARAYDMDSWQHDPRIADRGFAHRWQSSVAPGNGEDAFMDLVDQYLCTDCDVLDLGCGHGELTLILATRCRSIVGIERNLDYLELAWELTQEQNVTNAQFYHAHLAGADDEERDFVGIPVADNSIDLFINRRGPLLKHYLDEAMRVGRPGAVFVGLHPTGNAPAPLWLEQLPASYHNKFKVYSFDTVARWVTGPLQAVGIAEYSLWWIDVPEYLRTPHELYLRLSDLQAADSPEYQNVEPQFAKIFEDHRTTQGIVLRHQRLLWQARLPK